MERQFLFRGGCCFSAGQIAKMLEKKGIRYRVVCWYRGESTDLKEIVKVKKKLIDESVSNVRNALILEVEILDGKSAVTKREFMKFHDFIRDFKIGFNVKVIDSIDDNFSIDSYFE